MATSELQAIILAAGKSSRFNTGGTKLSFTLCGQEMIAYPAKLLASMNIPMTFVIGFQKQAIKKIIKNHAIPQASFIEQEKQLGTGHALLCSKETWFKDHILIMNGDVPLVTEDVINDLIEVHQKHKAVISFVTTCSSDPAADSYGRVIEKKGKIEIIEARHFDGDFTQNQRINAGIYLAKRTFLEKALDQLKPNRESGEIYITDLIKYATDRKEKVATSFALFDHVRGINTLKELWAAEHIKRSELLTYWMDKGVRFAGALNTGIDLNVEIGPGTYIGIGAILQNGTRIGSNCIINSFSFISNSIIHDNVNIKPHSAICNSEIHANSELGPYVHFNNAVIKERVLIGNFVELNRTVVGQDSKIKHFSYLANANIGKHVTIGAGTTTCNYNSVSVHETTIGDHAFIGTNNALVAPVTIGERAITGAGSVITMDIPADALGIARSRQVNKEHYAQKLRERWLSQEVAPSPIMCAKKIDNSTPEL